MVYDPGQGTSRFIPQIIEGCLKDEKFPVSKGDQIRDFCYIGDFVEAIFVSLGNKRAFGEVINIASGMPVSIKDIVCEVRGLIGCGRPQFGVIEYRTRENLNLYANTSKSKILLNWSSKTNLKEGLKKTVASVKRGLYAG